MSGSAVHTKAVCLEVLVCCFWLKAPFLQPGVCAAFRTSLPLAATSGIWLWHLPLVTISSLSSLSSGEHQLTRMLEDAWLKM